METDLPIITFNVPEEVFSKMFLGKPGDTCWMNMTNEFQDVLIGWLAHPRTYAITVTFEECSDKRWGDITATFSVVDA